MNPSSILLRSGRLFERWNEGKPYGEGVKPFGFMLVAFADPLKAGEQVGRLIHPYERNPKQWLGTEWADLYDPEKRYRIGVRRRGDVLSRRGAVFVRTYRDVLLSYLGHPEAKSLGPDGDVCRRHTRGMLARRPVEAVTVLHIGKEGNRLEERLSGLVSEDEALLKLGDDRSWEMLFRPTLATFSTKKIRKVCRMASNTLKDIVSGRTRPQARHERILRPAAVRLAAEQLRMWSQEIPIEPTALLAIYLQEANRRRDEIANDYEASLARLRELKSKRRGLVERVARHAGISRRRLWSVKDQERQQAVIRAIEEETGGNLTR